MIDNCLIYKNKGSWGGALYNETRGVEIVILNSTILDNTGGGDNNVCNYGGAGRLIVSNSICSATGVTVKMNLLTTTTFVNREAYDYSLLTGATAIDAGTPYEGMPDTDVFGNPRVSGVSVDVGAAEYQVGNLNASLVVDSTMRMFNPGVSYTLTPTVDGAVSTPSLVWTITRGDDVKVVDAQVTECEPLVFSPALPGAYSVRLSVTAGEKTVEVECPDMFVAGAREVFVNERGGDVYPYATDADAAHDFNSAWAFVGTNAVVHVAAGTYELAKAMELVHPIRVEGAGRDVTVLRSATGANDRIAVLDHSDAVLRNCTLAGVRLGSPSGRDGACVLFNKNGGLVENCRLTDNQGTSACRGGAVAFLGNSKGVLRQCQIDGNSTAGTSSCGGGVYTGGGGVVESCLIVGNSGQWANGIYFDGACAITNCTLVDSIYFVGEKLKIANTIVSSMNIAAKPTATTFTHCLKMGYEFPEGSVGNLSDDPCFVDAETGDYHLGRKSPCRGAGLYEPWMRTAKDLDGKPRASADTTDIGCYARPRKGLVLMVQ